MIIWKDGSKGYEASEPVILQGHMDMVAVKEADCDKNMEKEGLDLEINGDYISAKGTSLGGDDGIAVAYTLAVLDDEEMAHPPIEAIFTVNEEIGMLQQFTLLAKKSGYTFKRPDIILFIIIETVGSTCYNSILYQKPLPFQEYKPYLFEVIRAILKNYKD